MTIPPVPSSLFARPPSRIACSGLASPAIKAAFNVLRAGWKIAHAFVEIGRLLTFQAVLEAPCQHRIVVTQALAAARIGGIACGDPGRREGFNHPFGRTVVLDAALLIEPLDALLQPVAVISEGLHEVDIVDQSRKSADRSALRECDSDGAHHDTTQAKLD